MDPSYDNSSNSQATNVGGSAGVGGVVGVGGGMGVGGATSTGGVTGIGGTVGVVMSNANANANANANTNTNTNTGISTNVNADTGANVNISTGAGVNNSVNAGINTASASTSGTTSNINNQIQEPLDVNRGADGENGSRMDGGDEGFYESFRKLAAPADAASGDIILGKGEKKKRTGLIIGIIAAATCLIVGIIVFVVVGLPAMEPKTGDGVKAKNYQEAFNIYANYFLFGEKSKKEVNWEATKEEGFVSFFRKVVDSPLEVESIVSGEEEENSILNRVDQYYWNFYGFYDKCDNREDGWADYFDSYGKQLEFLVAYYTVGTPVRPMILEKYLEGGYELAKNAVQEIADKYKRAGTIYGIDIVSLIGRYGDSQLSIIRYYDEAGCLVGDKFNFECTLGAEEENEDIRKAEKSRVDDLNSIFSIKSNSMAVVLGDIFQIREGLENV